ncbi:MULTISPECIES: hypothetical protein [Sphingomonas]|uniref:hypothetical protein n=1 Tax=Sphingomonas TaxID=13687 RepID=UPI000DEED8BF|nr:MULTISPECIES: hypothetical protein [Sphingomonas]
MKALFPTLALLSCAACSSGGNIANNSVAPPAVVTETPGDWSALAGMTGRTPADSGLFTNSAISTDLDALLGPASAAYREQARSGSPLTRDGPVLVTIGTARTSFLVILPSDHALQAGLKQNGKWRLWTTPAAQVPRPAAIAALLAS